MTTTAASVREPQATHRWPSRWTAHWIWDAEPIGGALRQVIAARRSVHLDRVPDRAPGRAFADALYVMFVNGVEVRRGPGRANPFSRRYDTFDLAPTLRVGENVITIIAAMNAAPSRQWMPAPTLVSELAGGALAFEADLGTEVVATDGSWLTRTIEGWGLSPDTGIISRRGLELIDLGSLPADLHSVELADDGWGPARVKSGRGMGDFSSVRPPSYPYGPTTPTSLTPPSIIERPLTADDGGRWTLPEISSGTLVFDVEGVGGETIECSAFEVVEPDGSIRPFHEPVGVRLTAAPGRRRAETLDTFGLRGLTVEAPDGVTIHGITMRERTYPCTGAARFACSDPFLEQLYAAGRRTVTLCSLDAYVDTPTREGRAWTGDAVVHQMVDLATNGDWGLARWNPKMASLSTTADGLVPASVAGDGEFIQFGNIPDWSLHWVHAVWNLYRYVGDTDEIADLLPEVERVVRWFDQWNSVDTDLPTDIVGWCLGDWAWVPMNGASAVVAGLLGRACRDLAEMAEFVGDRGRAERARRRHARLVAGFEHFWDPKRERYADTLVDGERGPTASVHAQAVAIVGGLAPAERTERLVALLADRDRHVHATLSVTDGDPGMDGAVPLPGAQMALDELPEPWFDTDETVVMAQPFFRYVVHDALAAAGRSDLIHGSLDDWRHLLDRCPTSLGEVFFGGTLVHGWSCSPTRDLITRIVGVTPAEPGYAVVGIDPALGDLDWAEAAVPTPAGDVIVRVDRSEIAVTSPRPVRIDGTSLPAGTHRVERAAHS